VAEYSTPDIVDWCTKWLVCELEQCHYRTFIRKLVCNLCFFLLDIGAVSATNVHYSVAVMLLIGWFCGA